MNCKTIFFSLIFLAIFGGNLFCQRETWKRNITETTVTWTVDWSSAELESMFPNISGVTAIKSAVLSIITNTFSSKYATPTGITFQYVASGTADFTFTFENLGDKGGSALIGTTHLVKFDNDSHFFTSTSQASDTSFYFQRIACHEIGAVIVGSDHEIELSEDDSSFLNECPMGETVNKFNSTDASTIFDLYHCNVTLINNFNETIAYSKMYIDGTLKTLAGSDTTITSWTGTHNAQAVDQKQGNYMRLFYIWSNSTTTKYLTIPFGDDGYQANYLRQYGIVIHGGIASSGGTTYYENDSVKVKQYLSATLTGENKSYGGVLRSVGYWYKNSDTATHYSGASVTVTPTDHENWTMVHTTKIKPITTGYRYLDYSSTEGEPITLYWTVYTDTDITGYQIWRRIKDVQSSTLIATINSRTINSYTDNECAYTSSYTDNLIYYDVKPILVYGGNTIYSDDDYVAVYGDYTAGDGGDANIASSSGVSSKAVSASVVPTEYKLSNYPNPFNPATVIQYTMPEAGQVILKVYNMIGQEVKTLVDRMESAGVHSVNFNANGLPTGIYIARIQAGTKVMSLKLQLIK